MAEWLLLLLLVPAIVVPVVLLVGFAGCDRVFGIQSFPPPPPPPPPILVSAEGKSGSIIHLIWTWTGDPQTLQAFHFVRTNPDGTEKPFDAPTSPFETDDMGLQPATTYGYRVQAVLNDGSGTDFSPAPPAPPLPGTTLPFANTFNQPLTGPGTNDGKEWQGFTLVQRIEPTRLSTSGTQIIITLVAGSDFSATVDRIYISQPDPTAAMTDPRTYQPAADLTAVSTSRFQVPPSGHDPDHPAILILSPVNYPLDHTQALLIAVDFTAPPAATESWIRYADVTNPGEVIAYYFQGAEASQRPRSAANYTPVDKRIYFITNIDVK